MGQNYQENTEQNQIKRRVIKLNLLEYIERYKYVFITLLYFIILSLIDIYFISYVNSINQNFIGVNLNISKNDQTLFNTLDLKSKLLNNLYLCLYINIICFLCSLFIGIFENTINTTANNRQSNGIKTQKTETLQYFLIFVNFMVKSILSLQIVKFIDAENKSKSDTEILIEMSYAINMVCGIVFMVICCLPILMILFEIISNIFINFAKKITINVEESYIDTTNRNV